MKGAVGFSAHTGWAVAVVVAGDRKNARVVERRRLELADPDRPDHRFVYHASMKLPLAEARAFVRTVRDSANARAAEALATLVHDVAARGVKLAAAGLVLANAKRPLPTKLEEILTSHPLVHSAEGELY